MVASKNDFEKIYNMFSANIAKKLDCGKICAPLNNGQPACCTTENAIPIVEKEEWKLLKSRTDLWKRFKPFDKASKKIVDELPSDTCAVECKGASLCERDNRSLACRSFPFFPYFDSKGTLLGLTCYWEFEDRCWVISNLHVVEKQFVSEMIRAYEFLFKKDVDQREAFIDESKRMRKVFSRRNEPIQLISRKMEYLMILPKSKGRVIKTDALSFIPYKPFTSDKDYKKAIKEEGKDPKKYSLPKRPTNNF